MAYDQEQQVAIAAVRAAALLCEQVRRDRLSQAIEKQDRSPVTVADFGAQALLCQAIAAHFPRDAIVGEESAALLRQTERAEERQQVIAAVQAIIPNATPEEVLDWIDLGNGAVGHRYWTLDPVDGTKGFLRNAQYAIALALIEAGTVQLGLIGCPALEVKLGGSLVEKGVIFCAVRGQGTTLISLQTGLTYPLQSAHRLERVSLRLAESVERDHGNPDLQRTVATTVGLTEPPLAIDSLLKYGLVACGEAALYLRLTWSETPDYRENIWDHAAGVLVLEEAGGRVTDMHGKPLDFSCGMKLVNNRGIVASNAALYDSVLAALKQLNP